MSFCPTFTADKSQYKLIEGDWEGKKALRNQSPISGTNLQNIAITGSGITDNSPLISIGNSTDVSFSTFKPLNDFKTLFKISGEKTTGISLLNSAIPFALEKTTFDFGATNQSLSIK